MSDRAYVRRSSESSEAREVHLQPIRSHHQSTRACTTPVLTPPVTGDEQRRLHQLSKDLEKFRSEIIVSPLSFYPVWTDNVYITKHTHLQGHQEVV